MHPVFESISGNFEYETGGSSNLGRLSEIFGKFCLDHHISIVTAESCTAGLIAGTIADTPGSSAWLDRGFVVYTPKAKNEVLGVSLADISQFNITSEVVAASMALNSLARSDASLALAVTGVTGPTGGTDKIPVGTVCFGWAFKQGIRNSRIFTETKLFQGERNDIRKQVVSHALLRAMQLTTNFLG